MIATNGTQAVIDSQQKCTLSPVASKKHVLVDMYAGFVESVIWNHFTSQKNFSIVSFQLPQVTHKNWPFVVLLRVHFLMHWHANAVFLQQ